MQKTICIFRFLVLRKVKLYVYTCGKKTSRLQMLGVLTFLQGGVIRDFILSFSNFFFLDFPENMCDYKQEKIIKNIIERLLRHDS